VEARIIGEREFTDGVVRLVYEYDQGQYAQGPHGEMVRGVWLLPPDDAVFVDTQFRSGCAISYAGMGLGGVWRTSISFESVAEDEQHHAGDEAHG
jgi:hypothetical protein